MFKTEVGPALRWWWICTVLAVWVTAGLTGCGTKENPESTAEGSVRGTVFFGGFGFGDDDDDDDDSGGHDGYGDLTDEQFAGAFRDNDPMVDSEQNNSSGYGDDDDDDNGTAYDRATEQAARERNAALGYDDDDDQASGGHAIGGGGDGGGSGNGGTRSSRTRGARGTLRASPCVIEAPNGDRCRTRLQWNTSGIRDSHVFVLRFTSPSDFQVIANRKDGSIDAFVSRSEGTVVFEVREGRSPAPGQFTPQPGPLSQNGRPAQATVEFPGQNVTGTISASPCILGAGAMCTTTITWSTNGAASDGDVVVTLLGTPPRPFAGGRSGSSQAPWVGTQGATFQLRFGSENGPPILTSDGSPAQVFVTTPKVTVEALGPGFHIKVCGTGTNGRLSSSGLWLHDHEVAPFDNEPFREPPWSPRDESDCRTINKSWGEYPDWIQGEVITYTYSNPDTGSSIDCRVTFGSGVGCSYP